MSSSENPVYCSFVGIQYIICDCGEAFENEEVHKLHVEQRHKKSRKNLGKALPPITEYKCGECGLIYATEEECITHQEIDHMPMTEEFIPQEDEIIIPETEAQDIIIPSTSSWAESSPPLQTFNNQPPLRVQSLPSTRRIASPEKKNTKKKKVYVHKNIICETCGKKYASNAALRYHQRVHTGVRPYQCMYCPKNFTMALFLQIHVRTHTGEKPYQCANCPKAFSNRAALLRHDRVHTGAKPYQCPKCFKCFTQSNSMKLHFHTVHLKMPAPYQSRRRLHAHRKKARQTPPMLKLQEGNDQPDETQLLYEVKTATGRKICLRPGFVPKKPLEQENTIQISIEEEPQIKQEEVFYYEVKSEVEEEEVTYEVVYD